jgi:hypothetical protein
MAIIIKPINRHFIGEWKEDKIFGRGTLFYPNGSKCYEGSWVDDK